MKKVAVIGAGAWGTALAAHAARMEHAVALWALEQEVVDDVNDRHRNTVYLPDVALPPGVRASADMAEALAGADLVIFVPPSKHLCRVAAAASAHVPPNALVAVATKGIEDGSLDLMMGVARRAMPALGPERLAVLSGPSFAREVAKGLPTDVVVASAGAAAALAIQPLLHSPMFRVYTSADPVGVQVGGAVKNVIAVAAGACDGLGLGTNARAALITRGLAEITRLGVAMGADPLTFLGLSGVGDLVLTCTGALSRNRTLGMKVADGVDPRAYLASVRSVAEGDGTAAAAHGLGQKLGVDLPITDQVHHVLHAGRSLLEALKLLLTRDFKEELLGIRTIG
jgi:glycerol-3-phosphate dehydrogenase (NAD(P)+)